MSKRRISFAAVVTAAVLTAGSAAAFWFITDMYDMVSVKPQEGQPRAMPEGSIPAKGDVPPGSLPFHERLAKVDPNLPAENPVPATPESLEHGKMLYQNNCFPCHGRTGMGDGPVATRAAEIPPFPLVGTITGRTDAYLYGQIWAGGAIMGPYYMSMDADEVWDLINYLRSLNSP